MLEMVPNLADTIVHERRSRISRQRLVLDRQKTVLAEFLLAPLRPEFTRGLRGAVASLRHADGHEQLGISEQERNFVDLLVADRLADTFVHHRLVGVAAVRPLGLDYQQRDAVDEADDIGPPRARTIGCEQL